MEYGFKSEFGDIAVTPVVWPLISRGKWWETSGLWGCPTCRHIHGVNFVRTVLVKWKFNKLYHICTDIYIYNDLCSSSVPKILDSTLTSITFQSCATTYHTKLHAQVAISTPQIPVSGSTKIRQQRSHWARPCCCGIYPQIIWTSVWSLFVHADRWIMLGQGSSVRFPM